MYLNQSRYIENTFAPLAYRMSVFNTGKVVCESNNEFVKPDPLHSEVCKTVN